MGGATGGVPEGPKGEPARDRGGETDDPLPEPPPPSERPWVVLKFGGTSVASPERWEVIEQQVRRVCEAGERPLVVLSAVAGVTDGFESLFEAADRGEPTGDLIEGILDRYRALAARLEVDVDDALTESRDMIQREIERRDDDGGVLDEARAEISAVGETMSVRLGTARLRARGVDVASVDARDLLQAEEPPWGTSTADKFLAATCRREVGRTPAPLLQTDRAEVALTQGYLARDSSGRTVLLGRGGSDAAAAEIAARVSALRLEIWSDVPGVFTADPRTIRTARLVPALEYGEAETLAGFGAAVLHPRCITPARAAGVPVHLRWTERPDHPGTCIAARTEHDDSGAVGIVVREDLRLLSLERPHDWQPVGFMADVAESMRRHALSMDLVSSSPGCILTTVDPAASPGLDDRLDDVIEDLRQVCEPAPVRHVASVAIVGRNLPGRLQDVGRALASIEGARPLMVTHGGDGRSIAFVVPTESAAAFASGLHEALFGEGENVAACGPTWAELTGEPISAGGGS